MIGDPVGHSLSPTLHNAGFEALGIDWVYVALRVRPDEAPAALRSMRTLGIRGFSVTMPHKEAVAAAVDELTPVAARLGSVNCVSNHDGHLVGDSTDGPGFIAGLADDLAVDPSGADCVVLGAGGAARSVVLALAEAGAASVGVLNRSADRAQVAAALAGDRGHVVDRSSIGGADLLVNATPLGMDGESVPVPVDLLRSSTVVVDLIYHPARTPLLAAAEHAGCRTANGRSMLLHQAALQFESWTGHPAPIDAMRASLATTEQQR